VAPVPCPTDCISGQPGIPAPGTLPAEAFFDH